MLKKHIESIHETEVTSSSINQTVIVIDDEIDTQKFVDIIKCLQCEETFSDKPTLDKHTKSLHTQLLQVDQTSKYTALSKAVAVQENLKLKAIKELEELKIKLKEEKSEKERKEAETLQKLMEEENQNKAREKIHKKNIKQFQEKIVALEDTIKNYIIELDKQVQLKEKYAEEMKTIINIIKTHKALKDLKIDLQNVLSIEENELPINQEESNETSDNEWEDIESNEPVINDNGYVKVLRRRKKKRQNRRKQALNKLIEKCKKCDEQFASKSELKTHAQKHVVKLPFECKKCNEKFTTYQSLKQHTASCHTITGQISNSTAHTRKHKEKSEDGCNQRRTTFATEKEVQEHSTFNHTSIIPIKCRLCKFQTARQVDFLLHMESHNTENFRRRVCSWYRQDKCRFGKKCWILHADPPQCIFRNNCRAWPQCKFSHLEVCLNYRECADKNCNLEHPSRPFLGPSSPQKTPNIFSTQEFPQIHIQRSQGVKWKRL